MSDLLFGKPVKVLVTGGDGQIGRAMSTYAATDSFFKLYVLSKSQLDITNSEQVQDVISSIMPDYVINAAGFNDVDRAEAESDHCVSVNTKGAEIVALACGELSIPMLQVSTDYVFDGHYASGYTETDDGAPLGVYGQSKWDAEEVIRRVLPRHLILRTSWLFSEGGNNYVLRMLSRALKDDKLRAVNDRHGCPTSVLDLARVLCAIIKQLQNGADAWGTYHYSGAEVATHYGFSEAILAEARQYDERYQDLHLESVTASEYPTEAQRPASSLLVCKKLLHTFGIRQRPWRTELTDVMKKIYSVETESA